MGGGRNGCAGGAPMPLAERFHIVVLKNHIIKINNVNNLFGQPSMSTQKRFILDIITI